MIDVSVRQQHAVEGIGGELESAVSFDGLLPVALKKAAIQKDFLAAGLEQVAGAGHLAHAAEKAQPKGICHGATIQSFA